MNRARIWRGPSQGWLCDRPLPHWGNGPLKKPLCRSKLTPGMVGAHDSGIRYYRCEIYHLGGRLSSALSLWADSCSSVLSGEVTSPVWKVPAKAEHHQTENVPRLRKHGGRHGTLHQRYLPFPKALSRGVPIAHAKSPSVSSLGVGEQLASPQRSFYKHMLP